MTEVSNLLRNKMKSKAEIAHALISRKIKIFEERYIETQSVATEGYPFIKFGVSDSVLMSLAKSGLFVLTIDLPLHDAIIRQGGASLNFSHLRRV